MELSPSRSLEALAEVVPLGVVPPLACSVAAAHLHTVLGVGAAVLPAWPTPLDSHLAHRGQHDAAVLLALLAEELAPRRLRVGLTSLDLCLPMLTHVFGEARVGGQVAVVSLFRLGEGCSQGQSGEARRYERLAKVTVHEAGHALGLLHCRVVGCVMGGVPSVESLDALTLRLCPACGAALREHRRALSAPQEDPRA